MDLEDGKENHYILKEGAAFNMRLKWYVQKDMVTGLKWINCVYKMKVRVDKEEVMLGSFAPRTEAYEHTFAADEAPSGFVARGKYTGKMSIIDDDGNLLSTIQYSFEIKKDWK
eukprot:TRINITY_DN20892_c0_g1_i2.p3 TRINITY_DN20892_c0_g1~~TRINITY_DN20892_c0_g1_i2.p3  ORF type:complete len:113 (-),score=69.00 TRINITY_DN20892_c0_g1_i2:48-386(-)